MAKTIFQEMAEKWPSVLVARMEIKVFTGGLLDEKTMANYDCQGKGPANRFACGRKVAYPVKDLIEWLENRGHKFS